MIVVMARKYEQTKRAEQQQETRRRIVSAASELHRTEGPARTTMSAIAERARVQRNTLYRHFPDERSITLLRERQVRYVIVHRARMEPRKYTQLALDIANTPELKLWGIFRDPVGLADIFELQP